MRVNLVFLFFLILGISFAQTNLIVSYPSTNVLNSAELEQFQRYQLLTEYSSIAIIQLGILPSSVNESGNITIDLDGDPCGSLEFEPRNSRYISEEDYYYYGSLKDPNIDPSNTCICECVEGEIMIESKNGRRYGYISIDDSRYEILGLNNQYSVLSKIDPTFFSNRQECTVTSPSQGEGIKLPENILNPRTGGCMIRVLFLFTQAAENRFGLNGVIDRANLAITQTNQAFTNSAINNACVQLANIREWDLTEAPNDFVGDLFTRLIPNQQVATWRNTDLADVVILISNGGYANGLLGGVPAVNIGNPLEPWAYGIIEGNSITANFTFSHELGHIIGCDHQTCAQFQNNGCSALVGNFIHGFAWDHRPCWLCPRKFHSSILHQLNDSRRELHYSNPTVNHHSRATGAALRDNARWIRDGNACHVASYNPNPVIPLSASIVGEEILCRPLSGEYTVDVSGSNNPFNYEWHISTDGVNWGNSVGGAQSIWVNSTNYPLKSNVFLRVRVQDAIGNVVFAFFQISIRQKGTPGCNLQLLKGGNNGSSILAYPNPIQNEITVEFIIDQDNTSTEFILLNSIGQEIQNYNYKYSKGIHFKDFDLNELNGNIFYLKTMIDGNVNTTKIIKSKLP